MNKMYIGLILFTVNFLFSASCDLESSQNFYESLKILNSNLSTLNSNVNFITYVQHNGLRYESSKTERSIFYKNTQISFKRKNELQPNDSRISIGKIEDQKIIFNDFFCFKDTILRIIDVEANPNWGMKYKYGEGMADILVLKKTRIKEIVAQIDQKGVAGKNIVKKFVFALVDSIAGGVIDFDSELTQNYLYTVEGIAYNKFDFSNLLWGYSMARRGFSLGSLIFGSNSHARFASWGDEDTISGFLPHFFLGDTEADQRSILHGYSLFYNLDYKEISLEETAESDSRMDLVISRIKALHHSQYK